MRLSRWTALAGLTLLTAACSMEREAAPAPKTTKAAAAPAPATAAAPLAPGQGERAPFVVEGDLVKVNNTHCGVTRGPMGPEVLGRFTTRVEYKGADPRFQGKTFEFNQCCGMCIEKFPTLWAKNADEILAYHGVDLSQQRPN
jgi:hypothetical protein